MGIVCSTRAGIGSGVGLRDQWVGDLVAKRGERRGWGFVKAEAGSRKGYTL